MIFEKSLQKFLIDDNTLISNIILSTNSSEFDYIKAVDDKISFIRKDKMSTDKEESKEESKLQKAIDALTGKFDFFNSKGRVIVNPGKFVNLLLKDTGLIGDTILTADVEQWVNRFKSYFSDNTEIVFVRGEDIKWHYNSDNYTSKRGGSLWSCMSGSECQDRLDLYSKNPETIELAVQYDKDKKVRSRALVWTLMDNTKMMDRIYYSEDKIVNTYKRFCSINNIYLREELKSAVKSPIKEWAHNKYPYLDTMRLMDKDDSTNQYFITNGQIPSERDYIIPNGTAGYTINNHVRIGSKWYPASEASYCGISGKGMLKVDLTEVPRYGFIETKLVDVDKWNKVFYSKDLVESKIMNGKLSKQSAFQLKDGSDWIGRKKYRKMVADGKLEDGSALNKNKVVWVLEQNTTKQKDLESKIKSDISDKLFKLKKPIKEEELEKYSIIKLKHIHDSVAKVKYKSNDLSEWESWSLYQIENDFKSELNKLIVDYDEELENLNEED